MARTLPARALLFDNDGVLVDSDAASRIAWGAWADYHGLRLEDVIEGSVGRRSGDTVALHVPAETVATGLDLIERLEIETAGETRAMPGAAELMSSVPEDAACRHVRHARPGHGTPAGRRRCRYRSW
ncbi:MAG: hypothetical protein U0667_16885 [Chloroflexota bacterium]